MADKDKIHRRVGEYMVNMRDVLGRGGYGTVFKAVNERQKKMAGGYIGPAINSSYDGVTLNNPSYSKYYKGII